MKPLQEDGFIRCLDFLLRKWRINVPITQMRKFILPQFAEVPESEKPKLFKLSLATYFSRRMKQELPVGHATAVRLFQNNTLRLINGRSGKSNVKTLKFCFDLLQCKSLANEVPREMIVEAYQKHAKILSSPVERPSDTTLDEFKKFISPFIKALPAILPDTDIAPQRAYMGYSRKVGGVKKALQPSLIEFDYKSISPRLEPTCLHVEGAPGIGKSLLFAKMGKRFDRYFGQKDSVFWKSSSSAHYDGYDQQPVMGIDDIFYQSGKKEITSTEELLQLVSCVDFQPPMADLRHKGMHFVSPILLLSSNKGHDHLRVNIENLVNNREAFFRRLHLDFYLEKVAGSDEFILYDQAIQFNFDTHNEIVGYKIRGDYTQHYRSSKTVVAKGKLSVIESYLSNRVISLYEAKRNFYISELMSDDSVIRQHINGSNYFYQFPREPVPEIRIVEAYAIPEPLKVRMITKGHPDTYVLKPVQKAMFETLKRFDIFAPCWTTEYKVYSPKKGEMLVSGDYSSATDGICQDLTKLVGNLIAEKYPQLEKYIKCGTGEHIVTYPKGAKQYDILQSGGQLMGSLLSFPILCLINAFTLSQVRGQGLKDLDCLIHGDDISFVDTVENIEKWKKVASSLGLEPSIGKNYTHSNWYTIDSRIFLNGKNIPNLKWKQLSEPGPEEIAQIQQAIGKKSTVYFCKKVLSKTVRSLDVDILYGGLSLKGRKPVTRLETILYLGRSLDRIPRLTKGRVSIRSVDVESHHKLIQDPLDPLANDPPKEVTEQWYQEKKFLKRYNVYSEKIEKDIPYVKFDKVRLGPRSTIEFNSFYVNLLKTKIFKDLLPQRNFLNGKPALEETTWKNFPSERPKRRCFEMFDLSTNEVIEGDTVH